MESYEYGREMITNATTALMAIRDLCHWYNIPTNIHFDGSYITVIVNFGKGDSKIHRFYLQDTYRYSAKFDSIYEQIKKDIEEIVGDKEE